MSSNLIARSKIQAPYTRDTTSLFAFRAFLKKMPSRCFPGHPSGGRNSLALLGLPAACLVRSQIFGSRMVWGFIWLLQWKAGTLAAITRGRAQKSISATPAGKRPLLSAPGIIVCHFIAGTWFRSISSSRLKLLTAHIPRQISRSDSGVCSPTLKRRARAERGADG